MTNKSRGDD